MNRYVHTTYALPSSREHHAHGPTPFSAQYCSLYLNAEPLKCERIHPLIASSQRVTSSAQQQSSLSSGGQAASGPSDQSGSSAGGSAATPAVTAKEAGWTRKGLFRFTFTIHSADKNHALGSKEAYDHAFSHKTSNWGWAQFAKRDAVYFSNNVVKTADAFLITVSIQETPEKPRIEKPIGVNVPTSLVRAFGSLLDDPEHSDIVFIVRNPRPPCRASASASVPPFPSTRRIYAIRKILAARSEYFRDMFKSGFVEAEFSDGEEPAGHGYQVDVPPSHDPSTSVVTTSTSLSRNSSSSSSSSRSVKQEDHLIPAKSVRNFALQEDDSFSDHEALLEDSDVEIDHSGRDIDEISFSDDCYSPPMAQASSRFGPSDGSDTADVRFLHRVETSANSSATDLRQAMDEDPPAVGAGPGSGTQISPRKAKRSRRRFAAMPNDRDDERDGADRRKRRKVIVSDSSYTTFKALLFFLYTDTIEFAPLTSSFIDSHAATGASNERSHALHRAAITATNPLDPNVAQGKGGYTLPTASRDFASELLRAHRLRQSVISEYCANHPHAPVPCSAKAMYRLADKLQIHDLKKRAETHISSSLTVQNIVWEAFSSFASHYPDIRRIELNFLLSHWKEVKRTRALQTIFSRNHAHPGLADIWPLLLGRLDYRETGDDSHDEEDVANGLAASVI